MNIILEGGPLDGEIRRRYSRNTFACSTVEQVFDRLSGKLKYAIEHLYRSTSRYQRDETRPRAKFRVFEFEGTVLR